jgi:mycofactocin precursor
MTVAATEETAPTSVADDPTSGDAVEPPTLVEEELLVEDVSIDGMCGVY